MTTQDKEAVEAAKQAEAFASSKYIHGSASHSVALEAYKVGFNNGVQSQKQREKPVNGELEGNDF